MSRKHVSRLHARRWARVRRAVFERDGWRCVQCGTAGKLECDHILKDPGIDPYDETNLQTLCVACHVQKTRTENTRPLTPDEEAWQEMLREITL